MDKKGRFEKLLASYKKNAKGKNLGIKELNKLDSEDLNKLDEEDMQFCQMLAKLMSKAGFDVKEIEKVMAEIKTKEQMDYLFEWFYKLVEEGSKILDELKQRHESFKQVSLAVRAMQTASGLSNEAAKTCVYYAAATYGLKKLPLFPILVFQGPQGTGKSDAIKTIQQLVYKPIKIVGTNLSPATLRDELNKAKEATAFFEEGDGLDEAIISNRYSRATSEQAFKKELPTGWKHVKAKYFGATVLHKRKPFNDAATTSRCIIIKTRNKGKGDWHVPEVKEDIRKGLNELWAEAAQQTTKLEYSGRAADVWQPLIMVAAACYDIDWLFYSYGEVEKATESLKHGQQFEPDAMIVSALMAEIEGAADETPLVALSDIREWLKKEYNWQPTSWAIGDMVRNLDFNVKPSHGQQKVVVDTKLLAKVSKELGIE